MHEDSSLDLCRVRGGGPQLEASCQCAVPPIVERPRIPKCLRSWADLAMSRRSALD